MAVGIIGVVVSGLLFYYTKRAIDETDTAYQAYQNTAKTQTDPGVINDAWNAYIDSRDQNKPKAYGLVISGSLICTGSVAALIFGMYYLQKREKSQPVLSYIKQISVNPVFTPIGKMNGGGVNYKIQF